MRTVALPAGIAEAATASPPLTTGHYRSVQPGDDGTLTLQANAPPAPSSYGSFDHFGIAISPTQLFTTPFHALRIDYNAAVPHGSAVRVDLRSSADGVRWSVWEVDLAGGATATFDRPARFAQYRATLLANGGSGPALRFVRLTAVDAPATATRLAAAAPPVAPTWKVHATRMGMVGGRTANGHRIVRRDHFVALPSRRSLSSDGGDEYMVRISYNGRSAVAPVYDVGPWNIHDNYWDEKRERFGDLPRGWPQDHAAYFDQYNGGRAEKGRVRFPTAIDVGDGVWWDGLGIKGDRATVEVTFLWLGRDPMAPAVSPPAAPPPAPKSPPAAPPAAPPGEIVVDDGSADFHGQAKVKWYNSPQTCGRAGHALWTYTTTNAGEGENVGRWQPALPAEALYDVYVAIPACTGRKPNTGGARYLVRHRDGAQEVVVDQAAQAGTWVLLGRFPFRGDGGFVELRDVAGDSMRIMWFDAVKWVKVP